MRFEFDPAKSDANKAKHGIDFVTAQQLWETWRLELPSQHPSPEARWLVIGMIDDEKWTAVVTYRAGGIRLISCRRARRSEERMYEQAQ